MSGSRTTPKYYLTTEECGLKQIHDFQHSQFHQYRVIGTYLRVDGRVHGSLGFGKIRNCFDWIRKPKRLLR
jgi:hypothetical protein